MGPAPSKYDAARPGQGRLKIEIRVNSNSSSNNNSSNGRSAGNVDSYYHAVHHVLKSHWLISRYLSIKTVKSSPSEARDRLAASAAAGGDLQEDYNEFEVVAMIPKGKNHHAHRKRRKPRNRTTDDICKNSNDSVISGTSSNHRFPTSISEPGKDRKAFMLASKSCSSTSFSCSFRTSATGKSSDSKMISSNNNNNSRRIRNSKSLGARSTHGSTASASAHDDDDDNNQVAGNKGEAAAAPQQMQYTPILLFAARKVGGRTELTEREEKALLKRLDAILLGNVKIEPYFVRMPRYYSCSNVTSTTLSNNNNNNMMESRQHSASAMFSPSKSLIIPSVSSRSEELVEQDAAVRSRKYSKSIMIPSVSSRSSDELVQQQDVGVVAAARSIRHSSAAAKSVIMTSSSSSRLEE